MSSPLVSRSPEPIPGYRVVQRIGAGGYGEVWTAEAPGQLIKAIKFVYGLLDEDRAARELKALNRIKGVRHPFLLSLERIEVVDSQLLIVTELADCSLKDRYEQCRKAGQTGIAREELLQHLHDAADALDYMSEQHSLQHLDVKPENMLIVGGRIKVADFGLVKDIQDCTASMMGGLTPVYAPPEVFEGRPSKRSDQYSLAIVYQEMLTGMLPFPGKTAAQLAAQHLNARPRLLPLPAYDQTVVGRALSKNPKDRFNSCRELVEMLQSAPRRAAEAAVAAPRSPATPVTGDSATLGKTQAHALAKPSENHDGASDSGNVTDRTAHQSHGAIPSRDGRAQTSRGTSDIERDLDAASDLVQQYGSDTGEPRASGPWTTSLEGLEASLPAIDLPPLKVEPQQVAPPTIVIGIGGTAGRVLSALRKRQADLPAEQQAAMILLDTDSRDLSRAVTQTGSAALDPEDTVHLPLRKTQDYRTDSRKILEWLSRRWLYNIPRSLQTEGLRPLGRLAMVDSSDLIWAKLRQVMKLAISSGSSNQLSPRVIVVASIAGGTGSGMVIDIGYAARQVLAELGHAHAGVSGVLLSGTNRNPQSQQLAQVNSFALLEELAQLEHREAVYPGDGALGLKTPSIGTTPFDHVYVSTLGLEMSAPQYESACQKVADFLAIETQSPSAAFFEGCRREMSSVDNSQLRWLRTFGICQIGFSHDVALDKIAARVGEAVVQRWQGDVKKSDPKKSTRQFGASPSTTVTPPVLSREKEVESQMAQLVESAGLTLEPLMNLLHAAAAEQLGGDPEQVFAALLKHRGNSADLPIDPWLVAVGDLFGRRVLGDELAPIQPSPLRLAIEEQLPRLVAPFTATCRKWFEMMLEDPHYRLRGAQKSVKWLEAHLKGISGQLREMRTRMEQESIQIERALQSIAHPDPKSSRGVKKPTLAEVQAAVLRLCRLRMIETNSALTGQLVVAVQGSLLGVSDWLFDFGRELTHLSQQITGEVAEASESEASPQAEQLLQLKEAVMEQLVSNLDALAAEVDQSLMESTIVPAGGMRAMIMGGNDKREVLLAAMQQQLRRVLLARLEQIDLARLLITDPSSGDGADGKNAVLSQCLTSMLPTESRFGGERRLVCLVPQKSAAGLTPSLVGQRLGKDQFTQDPTLLAQADSDLVICVEQGSLSLAHLAASIIEHRSDLAQLAARLHCRSDIDWQPLLTSSACQ
ncbi:serine/threonine protein kinase [Pirellula staleyi DSM 6068]|uniref:non-specific serine/threonine protein kinase n=1 Tax=Pirellula staleyi (strain ATCC 27377 / DSM 6068 / ICPB 4128) TaxID=530564 RepID=D2R3E3_PIRSD|nr:tubulin-like doman-containing protein [Pirellula staleyi]ADB15174.1 serine/threonine protein kinase [Pirellula staleyi DSM 6068]